MNRYLSIIGILIFFSASAAVSAGPGDKPVRSFADSGLDLQSWYFVRSDSVCDSLFVIGVLENRGDAPIELCGSFAWGGGYEESPESRERYITQADSARAEVMRLGGAVRCYGPRLPMFHVIGPDALVAMGVEFECRFYDLDPGESVSDTTRFRIFPKDYESFPGAIALEVSFWTGIPGMTYRGARSVATAPMLCIPVPTPPRP